MKSSPQTHLLSARDFIFPVVLSLTLTLLLQFAFSHRDIPFGTRDYIAYWAGFHVFAVGGNPYSGDEILAVQRAVGWTAPEPQYYLNPPQVLVLLAPILALPFKISVGVWMFINILCAFLAVLIPWRSVAGGAISPKFLSLLALASVPVLDCIQIGQLSLVVTFGLALLIAGLDRRGLLIPSIGAALAFQKPHLILPLLVYLLLYSSKTRKVAAGGAFLSGVLCLAAAAFNSNIFLNWSTAEFSPVAYKSSTLVALIRESMRLTDGSVPVWPLIGIPALGLSISLLIVRRLKSAGDSPGIRELMIPLSLVSAPYCWKFDFSLLIVAQCFVIARAFSISASLGRKATAAFMMLHVILLIHDSFDQKYFSKWWFPLVFLIVTVYGIKKVRPEIDCGQQ